MGRLLLVFILVPLADLVLLLVLNKVIGFWITITMVIVSGILGAWLVRRQSDRVKGKFKDQIANHKLPDRGLISDGAMILFGAGLLITPGLLTDAFGLSLLIPWCREFYKKRVTHYLKENFKVRIVPVGPQQDPNVVDGEVVGSAPMDPNDIENVIEGKKISG